MIDDFVTIGKSHHPHRRVPASIVTGTDQEPWYGALCFVESFRILFLSPRGSAVLRLEGQSVAVLPPTLVFLHRGEALELTEFQPSQEDKIAVFHPRYIHDSLDWDNVFSPLGPHPDSYLLDLFRPGKELQDRTFSLDPGLFRLVDSLMVRMKASFQIQEDGYWPCRARSFLLQILILCSQMRESLGGSRVGIPLSSSDILPIQLEILKNMHADITVDNLAAQFGTNRTTLQKRFKIQTGTSVKQYQIRLRIQAAEIFLRNTGLTFAEIAERLGFSDEGTFSRAFKKQTGLPPSEVRNSFTFPRYL